MSRKVSPTLLFTNSYSALPPPPPLSLSLSLSQTQLAELQLQGVARDGNLTTLQQRLTALLADLTREKGARARADGVCNELERELEEWEGKEKEVERLQKKARSLQRDLVVAGREKLALMAELSALHRAVEAARHRQ